MRHVILELETLQLALLSRERLKFKAHVNLVIETCFAAFVADHKI